MNMADFFRFPDSGDKKRETPCALCGKTTGALVGKLNYIGVQHTDVVQCLHCGLISVDPIPSQEIIKEGCEKLYELQEANRERKLTIRGFRRSFRQGGHFARHYLKKHFKIAEPKILEIGSSDGYFSQGIKFHYPKSEIHYVDIVEDLVRYYRGHFECKARSGEFSSHLFPHTKFDLVIMRDILEHTSNPQKLLKEVHESLNPGGLIFILTPNGKEDFWMANQRFSKQNDESVMLLNHFHFYLPSTLEQMLNESGFKKELAFKYGLKGNKLGLGHKEFTEFNPEQVPGETRKLEKRLSMRYWRHHPTEVKWHWLYNNNFLSRIYSFFADREREVVSFNVPEGKNYFILAKKS